MFFKTSNQIRQREKYKDYNEHCIEKKIIHYTLAMIGSVQNIKLKATSTAKRNGYKTTTFQEERRHYKSTSVSINYRVGVYKFQIHTELKIQYVVIEQKSIYIDRHLQMKRLYDYYCSNKFGYEY